MRKNVGSATWVIIAIVTAAILVFLRGRVSEAPLAVIGVVGLGIGFVASSAVDRRLVGREVTVSLSQDDLTKRLAECLIPVARQPQGLPSHYRWNCWPMFDDNDVTEAVRVQVVGQLQSYLPYVDAVIPCSLASYRLFKPIEGELRKPVIDLTDLKRVKQGSQPRVILCDVAINRGTTLAASIKYAISRGVHPVLMFSVIYNDDWPTGDKDPIASYCRKKLCIKYLFTASQLVQKATLPLHPSYEYAQSEEKKLAGTVEKQLTAILESSPIPKDFLS